MLTFEDFIENKKDYYIDGENLILRIEAGDKKIAKNFISISNIYLEKAYSNGVFLQIVFAYRFKKNRCEEEDCLFIKLSHTGKIISFDYKESDEEKFIEVIKSTYKEEYKARILKLYKEYFQKSISDYIERYPTILAKCGWFHILGGKKFLSITYTEDFYPDFVNDVFDNKIANPSLLNTIFSNLYKEYTEKNSSNMENLFEFIISDPCILTAFAYSIHAISWNYIHSYSITFPEEIHYVFSLCIYGKNPFLSKKLANLLLNFFTVKPNKWIIIERKYHISTTSVSKKSIDNLVFYKSIPIIITSKNNHFTKTSSIIRKIDENTKINIYPVYISDSPIMADEILNCCSDSLLSKFEKINIEMLREQFIALLYNYVNYLSNISKVKYSSFIKLYNDEDIIENIISKKMDIPLLENNLNALFSEQSIIYILVKEWLNKYSLDQNDDLKKPLLKKWLDQYFLENFSIQLNALQDLREMILEEIMEEFYSVECANKPDISEERLQDPVLRKLYCSTLEKWQSEQIKFNRLRKELLMEWLHTHFPKFRLYQAMNVFFNYLEDTPFRILINDLKKYAEKCFLPQIQEKICESSKPQLNYLKLLYLFIQKNLNDSKNSTWIWEGQEERGEKEYCYYLHYKVGLEKFNQFLSKNSYDTLGKEKFDKLVKDNKVLKIPKGKANTYKRNKISTYVFIKKELDRFSK